MRYYNSDKPPLLLQGFELQITNILPFGILEDKKEFTTRVNRGIVNFLDYVAIQSLQTTEGTIEATFDASQVTLLAGGQQILVDEPAERYNYQLDLGERAEQKIPVIINGGQQLSSKIFLPDIISNSNTGIIMGIQLLAYYTTKKHEAFVKEYGRFGRNLGLKRQSFRLATPAGTLPGRTEINDALPKNQGKIIGVSFLFEGLGIGATNVNLSVDDIGIIEDVNAIRFSRLAQRDPLIFFVYLNPGSTFRLSQQNTIAAGTPTASNLWVTYYFAN